MITLRFSSPFHLPCKRRCVLSLRGFLAINEYMMMMSEGLAQGPYVAAGAGFEPATLRTQGTELTTEPPRSTHVA